MDFQSPGAKRFATSREPQPIEKVDIYGRRYLRASDATYALPKDLEDIPRLDFQHFLLKQVMQRNYQAPLSEHTRSMLDLGCGTGRWCVEMAQAFPHAQVLGIDLEEIQPFVKTRPANYRFQQVDILKPLPFASNTFDYLHQRLMLMSIPLDAWSDVLQEIVRVAQVGAWIELVEVGCTIWPLGPATRLYHSWLRAIGTGLHQDFDLPPRLAQFAAEAGMHQVQAFPYDIPLGWGGQVGTASLTNLRGFYRAIRPLLVNALHLAPASVDATWIQLAQEWRDMQAHIRYFVICGQK
ncbi:MAG: class I SAM-dependent methyltransferase [Ktedonobacteraceae bacterium]